MWQNDIWELRQWNTLFLGGKNISDLSVKKKKSYHQNPLSHLALFVLNWFGGKRCFSQLSTLFEHFFCGSSAVLCVGTKQLSINFKSKHHTWVSQVNVLFVWGGEGLYPSSVSFSSPLGICEVGSRWVWHRGARLSLASGPNRWMDYWHFVVRTLRGFQLHSSL